MDLIYYHAKCTDGWAAAYVAHQKYPEAKLVPAEYGTEPPFEEVEGKDVLIVDFTWKGRADNIKLNLLAKSLLILDHHKSAEETLRGLEFAVFDMKRSGAGLAWDHLFGKDSMGEWTYDREQRECGVDIGTPRPWYVDYVEDYDLWNKKLSNTNDINAYLHALPKTLEAWAGIEKPTSVVVASTVGMGMLEQQKYQVRALLEVANSGGGWGLRVGFVNAPYFMSSDLGKALADTHDVGMTWYQRKDRKYVFSLRSNDKGDIDVSKVAVKMGGGGHKHSAGFVLSEYEGAGLLRDILSAGPDYGITRCAN